MSNFALIAHRGFSAEAPENTMAAFRLAIESGFTNIELDVQLTNDKVPITLHDTALERTTDGKGPVSSASLAAIQALDAGSWFSNQYKGERVPTLREVLAELGSLTHLHIELKSDEPELAELVAKDLETANTLPRAGKLFSVPAVTITSFKLAQLERSLKTLPGFLHAWLVPAINDQTIEVALRSGIGQLCPGASTITQKGVRAAIQAGLSVRGQGIKTEDDLLRVYKAGAQGTTVNWPDRAAGLVGST